MSQTMDADVVIIGAGVVGAAIAQRLARYALRVTLLEAQSDVAMGTSRANSAIVHAGYDCREGSLMAALNVQGSDMMEELCQALSVHYQRTGSYVVAFTPQEEATLQELLRRGQANGVRGLQIVTGEALRQKESALSTEITAALYAPTAAIVCPYELTQALCENAVVNGVALQRDCRVVGIDKLAAGFCVHAQDGRTFRTRCVVNAAGLYADTINDMVGGEPFAILPRKGEYMLLDRSCGQLVHSVIFQTPSAMGKGVLVSPTVDGNLFAGPTAVDVGDKEDRATTAEGLKLLQTQSLRSVPTLPLRQVITAFAGLRAQCSLGHDFVIRLEKGVPGFVNVAGIASPGLSSAPAIAVYVQQLLQQSGLVLQEKDNYIATRHRPKRFRDMTAAEKQAAIARDPRYGRIICRCETIPEAEIVAAIHAPVGARTLDGVKYRTRTGMGRCQGGFCTPRVLEILSRELHQPMETLTKNGAGSELLLGTLRKEETR